MVSMPKLPLAVHILALSQKSAQVLYEALEAHKEGLEASREPVTVDPTLESPEDLTVIMATIEEDIVLCERMMEVLDVRNRT